MQEIICGVYRIFSRKFYKNYLLSGSNNSDEKLVYDVINYIDVHLESMENLSALSAEFGYSYTHIAQKFSAFTGESLKSYHTKRRFEKSNEYLRQGYSVTKVAELMGFKSIHAFSRAYKKYVGMAPREYNGRKYNNVQYFIEPEKAPARNPHVDAPQPVKSAGCLLYTSDAADD